MGPKSENHKMANVSCMKKKEWAKSGSTVTKVKMITEFDCDLKAEVDLRDQKL